MRASRAAGPGRIVPIGQRHYRDRPVRTHRLVPRALRPLTRRDARAPATSTHTRYFDTPEKLYLVLDYVEGGELFDRIVDEGNFTEKDASRIARQMTEAI